MDAIAGCAGEGSGPAPGEAGSGSSARRAPRPAVPEPSPGRQPHILVTEDDPGIRALLGALLTEEGYRVSLSSAQDVAEVQRLAPDLIVLDYWITGGAFLERLKADPATATVPILVLTGARREVEEQAPRLAALDVAVLLKPFDIEALLGTVRRRLAGAPGGRMRR